MALVIELALGLCIVATIVAANIFKALNYNKSCVASYCGTMMFVLALSAFLHNGHQLTTTTHQEAVSQTVFVAMQAQILDRMEKGEVVDLEELIGAELIEVKSQAVEDAYRMWHAHQQEFVTDETVMQDASHFRSGTVKIPERKAEISPAVSWEPIALSTENCISILYDSKDLTIKMKVSPAVSWEPFNLSTSTENEVSVLHDSKDLEIKDVPKTKDVPTIQVSDLGGWFQRMMKSQPSMEYHDF